MPIETREYYDQNMRTELDIIAQRDYAIKEGRAEGHAEGLAKGRAEGLAKGHAEGLAKGRAEGEAKGKADVAKAMLKNGLTVDMVMNCTGLSKKEVENLRQ